MALLSMRDVSIGFGGHPVLERIDLQIERGERLGPAGPQRRGQVHAAEADRGRAGAGGRASSSASGASVLPICRRTCPRGSPGPSTTSLLQVCRRALQQAGAVRERRGVMAGPAADGHDPGPHAARSGRPVRRAFGRPQAARDAAPAASCATRTSCCSTSRPTTWTSMRSPGWRTFWPRYNGTLVFVTHDRTFLRRLATRIIEVDRGRLIDWACDYDTFTARKQAVLGSRDHPAGRVRQEAGAGRGVDPPGHRGAAHAERGPGARAGADARRSAASAASSRVRCACRCRRPSGRVSW